MADSRFTKAMTIGTIFQTRENGRAVPVVAVNDHSAGVIPPRSKLRGMGDQVAGVFAPPRPRRTVTSQQAARYEFPVVMRHPKWHVIFDAETRELVEWRLSPLE